MSIAYLTEPDQARFDAMGQPYFDRPAAIAAEDLHTYGHSIVDVQPGDGTSYIFTMMHPVGNSLHKLNARNRHDDPHAPLRFKDRLFIGTQFGPTYEMPQVPGEPGYVYDKWTCRRGGSDVWTANVIFRFMVALDEARKLWDPVV
jgi:hypothetical protein